MAQFLRQGGGYKSLLVYKLSVIIFDITEHFIRHNFKYNDRTVDQMRQAARSGKQNIVEGSEASTTSKETEIKLTNVAKASFEELLEDYEDYLRVNNLERWDKNHPRFIKMKEYIRTDDFMKNYPKLLDRLQPYETANLCITLINQTSYLLERLIVAQQEQFLKYGGVREQMYRARKSTFDNNTLPTDPEHPHNS